MWAAQQLINSDCRRALFAALLLHALAAGVYLNYCTSFFLTKPVVAVLAYGLYGLGTTLGASSVFVSQFCSPVEPPRLSAFSRLVVYVVLCVSPPVPALLLCAAFVLGVSSSDWWQMAVLVRSADQPNRWIVHGAAWAIGWVQFASAVITGIFSAAWDVRLSVSKTPLIAAAICSACEVLSLHLYSDRIKTDVLSNVHVEPAPAAIPAVPASRMTSFDLRSLTSQALRQKLLPWRMQTVYYCGALLQGLAHSEAFYGGAFALNAFVTWIQPNAAMVTAYRATVPALASLVYLGALCAVTRLGARDTDRWTALTAVCIALVWVLLAVASFTGVYEVAAVLQVLYLCAIFSLVGLTTYCAHLDVCMMTVFESTTDAACGFFARSRALYYLGFALSFYMRLNSGVCALDLAGLLVVAGIALAVTENDGADATARLIRMRECLYMNQNHSCMQYA